MVEIFKTKVERTEHSEMLIEQIIIEILHQNDYCAEVLI